MDLEAHFAQQLDEHIDTESVNASAHQVTDTRLGYFEHASSLDLRQLKRRKPLPQPDHQFGSKLEIGGLLG
jgi:hypothetical protein